MTAARLVPRLGSVSILLALVGACSQVTPPPDAAEARRTASRSGSAKSHSAPPTPQLISPETGAQSAELRGPGKTLHSLPSDSAALSVAAASRLPTAAQALTGLRSSGIGSGGGGIGMNAAIGRLGGSHVSPARSLAADARPNTENYAHIEANGFSRVADRPLSTFSVDVDTASYANSRRSLNDGVLPPQDAVRVEEWLNYFSYSYPEPLPGEPFSVTSEVSVCPWNSEHRLLRLGLQSQQLSARETPPRNLVFLVDVSGSMMPHNKLPLLKRGLSLLAEQLRANDTISIVVYAGASGLALPATRGSDRARVLEALDGLEAGGSTNGGEGVRLAYATARAHFAKGGINRVILATDGDFNVGTASYGDLQRLIEEERKSGVFLTVLGFGEGNVKDDVMEMLADKGNGNYAFIDSVAEARKVLVREAGGTLVTVAKDVKLQVEFNPTRVDSYKLIGYENRLLAKEDFNDDQKDAGDIGAGHSVTALYELVPKAGHATPSLVDPLKYQNAPELAGAAASRELVTVSVRYKPPTSDVSAKLSRVIPDTEVPLAQASLDFRFSAAVAQAALALRGERTASSLIAARLLAESALGKDDSGDRHEFVSLLGKARQLCASSAGGPAIAR